MMRPDAKVQKVYLYPKPVDFRKSINGLAALVELDIKVEVFNPVLFVFLNRTRSQVKILYWERNGFCLWLKRLEAERFKTKPEAGDEAISLIETAKANGQEPYAWLRHVLDRLPTASSVEDYEALLPWNCSPASA